jgi:hypothetical protein
VILLAMVWERKRLRFQLQTLVQRQKASGRFSALPNELLCHIGCFLDEKDGASFTQTCVHLYQTMTERKLPQPSFARAFPTGSWFSFVTFCSGFSMLPLIMTQGCFTFGVGFDSTISSVCTSFASFFRLDYMFLLSICAATMLGIVHYYFNIHQRLGSFAIELQLMLLFLFLYLSLFRISHILLSVVSLVHFSGFIVNRKRLLPFARVVAFSFLIDTPCHIYRFVTSAELFYGIWQTVRFLIAPLLLFIMIGLISTLLSLCLKWFKRETKQSRAISTERALMLLMVYGSVWPFFGIRYDISVFTFWHSFSFFQSMALPTSSSSLTFSISRFESFSWFSLMHFSSFTLVSLLLGLLSFLFAFFDAIAAILLALLFAFCLWLFVYLFLFGLPHSRTGEWILNVYDECQKQIIFWSYGKHKHLVAVHVMNQLKKDAS